MESEDLVSQRMNQKSHRAVRMNPQLRRSQSRKIAPPTTEHSTGAVVSEHEKIVVEQADRAARPLHQRAPQKDQAADRYQFIARHVVGSANPRLSVLSPPPNQPAGRSPVWSRAARAFRPHLHEGVRMTRGREEGEVGQAWQVRAEIYRRLIRERAREIDVGRDGVVDKIGSVRKQSPPREDGRALGHIRARRVIRLESGTGTVVALNDDDRSRAGAAQNRRRTMLATRFTTYAA